jgi:hypothetical protein
MAMTIVEQSGGQYHVLVIIADGQVFYSLFMMYRVIFEQIRKTTGLLLAFSFICASILSKEKSNWTTNMNSKYE